MNLNKLVNKCAGIRQASVTRRLPTRSMLVTAQMMPRRMRGSANPKRAIRQKLLGRFGLSQNEPDVAPTKAGDLVRGFFPLNVERWSKTMTRIEQAMIGLDRGKFKHWDRSRRNSKLRTELESDRREAGGEGKGDGMNPHGSQTRKRRYPPATPVKFNPSGTHWLDG